MKKKKFNFFEKIIFTILFGISSICLLGGWTNNNGTLINDDTLLTHLQGEGVTLNLVFDYNNLGYDIDYSTDIENLDWPCIAINYINLKNLVQSTIGTNNNINNITNLYVNLDLHDYDLSYYSPTEFGYLSFIISGCDLESYATNTSLVYIKNNYQDSISLYSEDFYESSFIHYANISSEWRLSNTNLDNSCILDYLEMPFGDWTLFEDCYENTKTSTNPEFMQLYVNTSPLNYQYVDNRSLVFMSKYDALQRNYNTLQLNYNTLQTSYTNLENEYSLLNTQYETLDTQFENLQTQYNDLQSSYNQLQQEYEDYQDLINNTVGITSFDISQYSVSVGNVPNQPSFDYTKNQDLTNNFTTIGYLNISDIYTNYILPNNGSTNNTIYITTPQSNLLTFDLIFNYITQPNTMLKTTLTLPDGTTQQFLYSSTAYDYKEEWTLANLVSSTTISENYNMNDISYKDLLITWENIGNNLSDIKIGSNNGFNTGFNNGYNTSLNKINEIQQELNSKTSLLEKATIDLQNKTNEYNMLLARYQQVTETPLQLNFQNLIWTIASSPFESFKQIWNVDILGFNIANFVIGVMSVFVVMYIIKKIF